MNIKYGTTTKETRYVDGKEDKTVERVKLRDIVMDDQQELALFLKFQKESKDSEKATFTKELRRSQTGKVNRYVVREFEV